MTSYEDFSCLYNLYNETMCSLAFYLWFGFTCIVFASRPLTKPTQYWSWPPQSTSREVELNTLDLGSPMGATQWGSGTCILGPGLVPVLTMLEGLGSVYGLWVKITVARSNRKWGCQEEEVYAGVVYRKTHAQSFTSKFNSDINTLRGNKCEQLNQNQPFTFLWFLKFTHSLASLTQPSSTHPSLPLQEVKKVNSDISSTATPSLATLPPVPKGIARPDSIHFIVPQTSLGALQKKTVWHAQKTSMNILTASYSDALSELKFLPDMLKAVLHLS